MRLEQENRKAEDARQRAVEEAEENRLIANKTMVLSSCSFLLLYWMPAYSVEYSKVKLGVL